MNKMYENVKTWNPFKGCRFQCSYCVPSFQAQAKRQKHNCMKCYNFEPHEHPERLTKIPSAKTIFVCGNGDISFARVEYRENIARVCRSSNFWNKTLYWQSKNPKCMEPMLKLLHENNNIVLLTTLETNRDRDYHLISKAPAPTDRAYDFMQLPWPRKIVTIEPIMDFDHDEFLNMILDIKPEAVYIGYNSKPGAVKLPEPKRKKTEMLIYWLERFNVPVKTKYLPWEEQ